MVPDPRRQQQRSGQAADSLLCPAPQQPAPSAVPAQQTGSQFPGGGQPRGADQQQTNPLVLALALPKAGGALTGLGK